MNTLLQVRKMNHMLELFENQAGSNPDAIALIHADRQMTYRELDQRSSQLARYLLGLSIKPETLVGICMPRSLDMIVAILGVFKSGGAYVPLDPAYPEERLSFVLSDASAPVVITESTLAVNFSGKSIRSVCMDTDWDQISQNPVASPLVPVTPESVAYAIYTSGSTGKPKGVMITHSNLLNFIRISTLALDVTDQDVCLQTASISYALSVRQIMIPLCVGATLVIASAEEMRDPVALFNLIKNKNISLIDMVPSFWRACLQRLSDLPAGELETLMDNSLRRIVSIGEALSSDLPRAWTLRFGSKVGLVNIFGQTETTGVVAIYPIPQDGNSRTEIVPIGGAIPDTQLYLLDSELKPVPQGEQGELCVSSPCIARGYLNRPELTAEKFVLNPFDDGLSTRLYRTGDLARMREDGSIEFLGRGDYQVKIRGQRVELGEIEAWLREYSAVRDCAVAARGDQPDDKYLVAYVVPAEKESLNTHEIRNFLLRNLPAYMVPSFFILMDSLPLTPNGKLDRLALPEPDTHTLNPEISNETDHPTWTPMEQAIADIWRELLNLDHVDIHDNFFDLGGHSLAAVRLFSRIEQHFDIRLPPATILQASTVAQLAEYIQNYQPEDDSCILIPIQTTGHGNPFFLIHGVGGGVMGYHDLVEGLGQDRPVYGVEAVGLNCDGAFDHSIDEMASRYIKVIRSCQPEGPYLLGGYCFGAVVAYEMACQLEKQGQDVALLALFEAILPAAKKHPVPFFRRVIVLLENLPIWIKDYASMPPGELRFRTSTTLSKIRLKIKHQPDLQTRIRVQEILDTDLDLVPDRSVELTKIHAAAFERYVPGTYGGQVTVFRARNRSVNEVVFDSLDPTMGWDDFARGGVEVRLVDGFHRNIHLPPYVASLSSELKQCLTNITKGG
jgi:amino acid adenylation domain-containing protein